MIKRILAMLGLLLFVGVLVLVPVALYGDSLYRESFTARESAEAAYITSFDLLAEETKAQAQVLVNGWRGMTASKEVTAETARGKLSATVYEPVGGDQIAPWAIVLHGGIGTERTQVLDVACRLSLRGYRVLLADLYAHGKSAGETTTLGFGDTRDVRAWVEYIEAEEPHAKIVLFGFDEGAAAVLTAAGEGLKDSVAAVAADSASNDPMARMLSVAGVEEDGLQAMLLKRIFARKAGVNPELLSQRLSGVQTPMLLIHGTGDQEVPAWNSEDIAKAAANAQLLYIEGAGHGQARYLDETLYYDTLFSFYENALK